MTKKRKAKIKPKKRKVLNATRRQLAKPIVPEGLTPKQERFVVEYMIDLNGTQAAIRAGYAKRGAGEEAYRLLKNAQIAQAIADALRKTTGSTPARIVDELAAMAFSDIGKAVEWNNDVEYVSDNPTEEEEFGQYGNVTKVIASKVLVIPSKEMDPRTRLAVAEISQGEKGQLKIKMHPKADALDKLAKVLGMYNERVDVDIKHSETRRVIFEYYGASPKILERHQEIDGHSSADRAASEAVGGDRDEGD